MKQIHTFNCGSEYDFWAKVLEDDNHFRIIDGWNMGQMTELCIFPNLNTARTYIAGKWNVDSTRIVLVDVEKILPVLSADEKIIKVARQLYRGMILESEFCEQMARIINEEWEAAYDATSSLIEKK